MLRNAALVLLLPFGLLASTPQDGAREAFLSLVARDYGKAIAVLEREFEARRGAEELEVQQTAERVLFLLANARLIQGDAEAATRDFARHQQLFPDSPNAALARFGHARALARRGDWRNAARGFGDEVRRILSPERRVALSETYTGLVAARLNAETRDVKGAIHFLDLAIALELPRAKEIELRRRAAALAYEAKMWQQADARYAELVKMQRASGIRVDAGIALEDRLALARARSRAGKRGDARRLLEDLLREGLGGDDRALAMFEIAETWGLPKAGNDGLRGVDALRKFLETYPRNALAPRASWLLVRTLEKLGRVAEALEATDTMLGAYADRSDDEIAQASVQRALLLGRLERYDDAIQASKQYLARFPAHTRWVEAQRAIVSFELGRADVLRKRGVESFDEAAELYYTWLSTYPLDARASAVSLRLGEMAEAKKDWALARERYARTAAKYAKTSSASKALYQIGRLLETELFDYRKAIEAYRKVTGGQAGAARARIAALSERSLVVKTDRVFRSDEKAAIRVLSRNIEKLRVRVYKLDYETFFRGTRGRGDVAKLAVEVISPDSSFEDKIVDYVPYRETEREVRIPADGVGAWVVKVDDGKLEATSLVFVSDLGILTKASRKELFVFAQNTRTQTVQSGAKIVLSDGAKVVAEGRTDANGVWRYRGDAMQKSRLFAFATTAGGSGATTLDLSSLRASQGLQAKAAIWTDRVLYAPGDTVHAKCVMREVETGNYRVPAREAHRFDCLDASGRLIHSREIQSDDYGTLLADFEVPEEAKVGAFSLRVQRVRDRRVLATQRIAVERFAKPRVSMQIETKRSILMRGEKITGKVVATWFFGGPVQGRRVELRANIDGGRVLRGTTDEEGSFAFSFETDKLPGRATVQVDATIAEENASVRQAFELRDREFGMSLSLPSSIFVAGDDLEATVVVRGFDEAFLERDLRMTLYRLEPSARGMVERAVASKAVRSALVDGVARARFEVAKGGRYRLRASATDRFGQAIEANKTFFVSGDEDKVKLRVLSSSQYGSVGDRAKLRVLNRAKKGLALVTIEGDGVLRFEARSFELGETRLDLPFEGMHAPNFAWSISMLGDAQVFTARKDFIVTRPLRIEVRRVDEGPLRPGALLPLEVRATDGAGRPVEAELSLALVDQALLDLRPDRQAPLSSIFWGSSVRRFTKLMTRGSTSFAFEAVTRAVNRDLKAEELRRDRALREERAKADWSRAVEDFRLGSADKKARGRSPRLAALIEQNEDEEAEEEMVIGMMDQAIGIGGGAGGRFGGRRGGKVRRKYSAVNKVQFASKRAFVGSVLNTPNVDPTRVRFFDDSGLDGDALAVFEKELAFQGIEGLHTFSLGRGLLRESAGRVAKPEQPRLQNAGSSIWIGRVRCDAAGRARIEVRLPRREGSWRLRARGLSKDSLFGEAKQSFALRRDLLIEPVVPQLVLEGDKVHARLGVHWLGAGKASLSWKVERSKRLLQQGAKKVSSREEARDEFEIPTERAGSYPLLFTATANGETEDKLKAGYRVAARAIERRDARSGLLSGERRVRLRLPEGEYRARSLIVEVGPELPSELLPSAPLSRRYRLGCGIDYVVPTHSNRVATGLAALALLESWRKAAPDRSGALAQLSASVESTIREITTYAASGRLAWIGDASKNAFDPKATALATLLLARARRAGFVVDGTIWQKTMAQAKALSASRDLELASLALYALASDGRADFARFNTILRSRSRMSLAARARLLLAAIAMRRPGLVADVKVADEVRARIGAKKRVNASDLRATLWATLALQKTKRRPALVAEATKWLWTQRSAWGFSDAIATALSAELYTAEQRDSAQLADSVEIRVGDKFRKVIDLREKGAQRRVRVPAEAFSGDEVVVSLSSSGRGRALFSAELLGTTKGLPEDDLGARSLTRRYLQRAAELDGKSLPEGFSSVDGTVKRWRNFASECAIGDVVHAELTWMPRARDRARYSSVVVEEPLPAGVQVRTQDVSGNFDKLEVGQGFLRFYLHGSKRNLSVRYSMRGAVAGRYGVLPPRVFSLEDRALQLFGKAASFRVRRAGEEPSDERRSTPDELLARGVRVFDGIFAAGQDPSALAIKSVARDEAELWLRKLWDEYRENLREQPFKDCARRLLRIALAKRDAEATIGTFEALRDRDPGYVLSFEDSAKVADAYFAAGEFERCMQFREAICETAFLREVQIAGTLDEMGETIRSTQFMRGLFQNFPGLPSIRGAIYSLAQSLNERATATAGSSKVTAIALRREARELCREYLWRYPDDGDADEVSFTLASIALDADQVDEASELLERAQRAHQESVWLDDFIYLAGYAAFMKGEGDKALALLERVANGKFRGESGRIGPSESRELAVFLQGQIHHAAGRPQRALEKYGAVEKRFVEATQAADYFRAKKIELPEVQRLAAGSKAKLKLVHRNLERVSIAVYKVDLMRLYLLRKSLTDVGSVQLFGISPVFETELDLRGDARYREVEREIDLPIEGRGSWLALARTGSQTSSSLLLCTSLEIDAQELPASGRIRVNVKRDGLVLPKATVKVVGDRDGKIQSGSTDLRGIFVADAVVGRATVLVQSGDDYAFYRGKMPLGNAPRRRLPATPKGQQDEQFDALLENRKRNIKLMLRGKKQLQQLYKNTQRGVDIRRAK